MFQNQRSTSGRGNQKKFQSRPNNNSSLIVRSGSGARVVTIKNNNPRQRRNRNENKSIIDESIFLQGPLVKAPINSSRAMITSLPSFNGSQGVRIRHRELLMTPADSAAALPFQVVARFRINPGSKNTFNWLGTIGPCFETFKFRSCRLHYYPRCPTTTAGSLILSPDYDAADAPPTSEDQTSQNSGTKEDAPWKESIMTLNPAMLNRTYKGHYVMTDLRFDSSTQDEKTIDPAQVFVCRDTAGVTIPWGKLWIEYDVELFTPQTPEVPIDQGGGTFSEAAPTTGATSLGIVPTLYGEIASILENATVAYPGNTMGNVTRDWKGAINTIFTGTGITNVSNFEVIRNGAAIPQLFTDSVINAGATKAILTQDLDLRAGDILNKNELFATTLGVMNGLMGAVSTF